jgi:hypothetical protein|tara:strand:- start:546 stop:758 length:213 start_codon:yes stop_codon:yes gene_type:complete
MPDPVLIPAILSLSFSGVIGIISQIQHSRCTEIRCLGCSCIRRVPREEEEQEETTQLANPVSPRIQTDTT